MKFCQVVVEMKDPNDYIIIEAFTKGTTQFEQIFYDYITWDKTPTKAHLFARCEKYLGRKITTRNITKRATR